VQIAGTKCPKVGQKRTFKKSAFVCKKTSKGSLWISAGKSLGNSSSGKPPGNSSSGSGSGSSANLGDLPPVLSGSVVYLAGAYDPASRRLGALTCNFKFPDGPRDAKHLFGLTHNGIRIYRWYERKQPLFVDSAIGAPRPDRASRSYATAITTQQRRQR